MLIRCADVYNATVVITGDVLIFTGMLSVATTDGELAVVLGHEIAHMLADHPRETFNKQTLSLRFLLPLLPTSLLGGLFGIGAAFLGELIFFVPAAALLSPNLVVGLLHLYNSRVKETEADYIGLLLMAEAGYNPAAAVSFWSQMGRREEEQLQKLQQKYGKNKTKQTKQWESTHPLVSALLFDSTCLQTKLTET